MDVEVSKEQNGWGDGTKLGEKFRQIRGESRVRFGVSVNYCSNQGLGTRQFKSKVFKRGGGQDGYCSCNDVLKMNCGDSTASTMVLWLVNIRVSWGYGLVE